MITILIQTILKGNDLKLENFRTHFNFDKIENDYALINEKGSDTNYLNDLNSFVDRLSENYQSLKKANVENIELAFIFSYTEQGNIEIPLETLKKIVEMNCTIAISFYETK
ncbi:MAG: hypothetical protein Q4G08_03055 [Capnocytophaga sp.]|nr:hypothetical protein [Capnocytophaga sp.]